MRTLDDVRLPVDHDRTVAEYLHLRRGSVPHENACQRVGVSVSHFEQICRRRGIPYVGPVPNLDAIEAWAGAA